MARISQATSLSNGLNAQARDARLLHNKTLSMRVPHLAPKPSYNKLQMQSGWARRTRVLKNCL